jgi:hypothetical protein
MKRNLIVALIISALTIVLGSMALAQRTGGYREIDKSDEGAMAAAEFAVKEFSAKKEITYKLIEIEKAESQVVAGINYRLCLKIGYHKADDDVDATETIRVVVYRNLQNQYSLTSSAEEDCSDEGGQTAHR